MCVMSSHIWRINPHEGVFACVSLGKPAHTRSYPACSSQIQLDGHPPPVPAVLDGWPRLGGPAAASGSGDPAC